MHRDLSIPHRPGSMRRRSAVTAAAALVAVLLAGCTPGTPDATSAPSPSGDATNDPSSPAPTPPASAPPVLMPAGSATDNLPLFQSVTVTVWNSDDRTAGRAYIDALVSAGFDKTAMQVTEDRSTVGNPAESIQFSVRWGEECLVGQVGPATGEPVAVVVPVLVEGTCLVGQTRPIDW